jgi:hypothetical protein
MIPRYSRILGAAKKAVLNKILFENSEEKKLSPTIAESSVFFAESPSMIRDMH